MSNFSKNPELKFLRKFVLPESRGSYGKADLLTDRHDEASSRCPLCERAKKWTITPALCTVSTFVNMYLDFVNTAMNV
jgi:hypothetical protein